MRHFVKSRCTFAAFILFATASTAALSASYKYIQITNNASPLDYIYPIGVNDNNVVVGADYTNETGFVWQGGQGITSSEVAFFSGVNNNNIAVGAAGNSKTGAEIVFYNVATDTYQSSRLGLPGNIGGLVLNLSGVVAGEVSNPKIRKFNAFLFSNGKPTHIRPPKQKNCYAISMNDSNAVVGTCNMNAIGYLYSSGVYTVLKVPGSAGVVARFITNSGIIGGAALIGSGYIGFSYSGGVYTTYTPTLSNYGEGAELIGELPNGDFVGDYGDKAQSTHGFLYSAAENKYYELDYPGAVSTSVTGIGSNGSLVGVYQTTVNGPFLAFIATCKAKNSCNS